MRRDRTTPAAGYGPHLWRRLLPRVDGDGGRGGCHDPPPSSAVSDDTARTVAGRVGVCVTADAPRPPRPSVVLLPPACLATLTISCVSAGRVRSDAPPTAPPTPLRIGSMRRGQGGIRGLWRRGGRPITKACAPPRWLGQEGAWRGALPPGAVRRNGRAGSRLRGKPLVRCRGDGCIRPPGHPGGSFDRDGDGGWSPREPSLAAPQWAQASSAIGLPTGPAAAVPACPTNPTSTACPPRRRRHHRPARRTPLRPCPDQQHPVWRAGAGQPIHTSPGMPAPVSSQRPRSSTGGIPTGSRPEPVPRPTRS